MAGTFQADMPLGINLAGLCHLKKKLKLCKKQWIPPPSSTFSMEVPICPGKKVCFLNCLWLAWESLLLNCWVLHYTRYIQTLSLYIIFSLCRFLSQPKHLQLCIKRHNICHVWFVFSHPLSGCSNCCWGVVCFGKVCVLLNVHAALSVLEKAGQKSVPGTLSGRWGGLGWSLIPLGICSMSQTSPEKSVSCKDELYSDDKNFPCAWGVELWTMASSQNFRLF